MRRAGWLLAVPAQSSLSNARQGGALKGEKKAFCKKLETNLRAVFRAYTADRFAPILPMLFYSALCF
jgi:hypothetical protein